MNKNTFNAHQKIASGKNTHSFYRLKSLTDQKVGHIDKLPFTLKILLENLLRQEDGLNITADDIKNLAAWDPKSAEKKEISFMPARVILQDFTGVPCVVDLASMRDAIVEMGGKPEQVNPLQPVDLVIDHSVQVDKFGSQNSFNENVDIEYERNKERYAFLKWGQKSFKNFRVVPPGTGIVHQVNLEYLGQVVFTNKETNTVYPDTLIGTDSHTTMINGLGIVGWGVGGIEAEAAMLGQPISMLIPDVVGFKLTGKMAEGMTATDLVLTVTQMLRKKGVVGKFVEFYGDGLDYLSLPDRATIANMAPEYGATVGFFPVDKETLRYLELSGRDPETIKLVETYCKEQGLFRVPGQTEAIYSDRLVLDLSTVTPSIAGPKRPQDRIHLYDAKKSFSEALPSLMKKGSTTNGKSADHNLDHGSVVISAITSCTNTSNPSVLIEAGLLAKKASEKGLTTKPWVKTSLAPGSKVVVDYLTKANLMEPLENLGFYLVGYGCTTCIGNSGPLPTEIEAEIKDRNLVVASVLSGNRNFEGRIHPNVRANYLMSPPLVVAFALAGRIDLDLSKEPIGKDKHGNDVFLKDIWPTNAEVQEAIRTYVKAEFFKKQYSHVFDGDDKWKAISIPTGERFQWDLSSTYIRRAQFLENIPSQPGSISNIEKARVLALLGDSVTTDHISPAGSIAEGGPAAAYLKENGVSKAEFNSFGSRRGNHEVMVRGTFANVRLKNQMAPGTEGGVTKKLPENKVTSIYEAATEYQKAGIPLIVLAGKEYGSGSSRDWAAKGTNMLGIKAVIAESFERIHRSNLVMMGVLPLEFKTDENVESLGLTGDEEYTIAGLEKALKPRQILKVSAGDKEFEVIMRIDTPKEIDYFQHGGILPYVIRQLLKK